MTVAPIDKSHNLLRTPKEDSKLGSHWTLNKLIKQFNLNLDPCCSGPIDAMCEQYFTPKENGLKQEWKYNTIFNPPSSKPIFELDGTPKISTTTGQQIYES